MRINEKFGNTKIHNVGNVAEVYKLFKLHTVLYAVHTFLYLKGYYPVNYFIILFRKIQSTKRTNI